jgi:hypothetical protein
MKIHTKTLFLPAVAGVVIGLSGCSWFRHHEPKSTFKIIDEGDPNPFIKEQDEPTRAGTTTRKVDVYTN